MTFGSLPELLNETLMRLGVETAEFHFVFANFPNYSLYAFVYFHEALIHSLRYSNFLAFYVY